jgi:hypothetical protein
VQGIDVYVAESFADAVESFSDQPIQAIASYTAFQDLLTADLGGNKGKSGAK